MAQSRTIEPTHHREQRGRTYGRTSGGAGLLLIGALIAALIGIGSVWVGQTTTGVTLARPDAGWATTASLPASLPRLARQPQTRIFPVQQTQTRLLQAIAPTLLSSPGGSLANARREAVRRGMRWLDWYIRKHWSYTELGVDAVYIFRELAETTDDEVVRRFSFPVARRLALQMKAYFQRPGMLEKADSVLDALDLLTFHRFLKFDPQPLLEMATRRFAKYDDAEALFGMKLGDLNRLSEDQVFELLINTYVMEKIRLTLSPRLATDFHLGQVIAFLRTRAYVNHRHDVTENHRLFSDHAYLATHVAFVLNNYGVSPLSIADIPRVYPFLRDNFAAIYRKKDIELVAEFLDVYRAMGLSEVNDRQVELGTRFLLATQAADGSWGPWRKQKNPYDAVHYTWAAVHGLRERFLRADTQYRRHLKRLLERGLVLTLSSP